MKALHSTLLGLFLKNGDLIWQPKSDKGQKMRKKFEALIAQEL